MTSNVKIVSTIEWIISPFSFSDKNCHIFLCLSHYCMRICNYNYFILSL